MLYNLIIFSISAGMALAFSIAVQKIAFRLDIIDMPKGGRKIHDRPTPLLGGVAVFAAFFIMLWLVREKLIAGELQYGHWIGFFAGALLIMIGGVLDDKFDLPAVKQVIFPILASMCVIAGGVTIEKITNPFGGFFHFSAAVSAALIFIWLMGMMYTTKTLDGLDGLVTGITAIGGLIIFLFTTSTKYYQPDVGLAALVLTGVCLGFLFLNWHPAKIFLGEGGSVLMGFILGVLAIISGGKIAIALLVMGIPIMDLAWTIIRRLLSGKNPFKHADRKHLHFRILDMGLGQRKTVLIYYALAAVFGSSVLYLQSLGKILAMSVLVILMFFVIIGFSYKKDSRS
ncbi:MAG: MraY family glycosyltransferase [Candidatus Falkowbacteria bacterium]